MNAQQQANHQLTGLQQECYQIAPGQHCQPNLRGPSGSQHVPEPHPQTIAPSHPPMQMQQSDAGPPVPPKDGRSPPQQPQVANRPVRQGSPGASKWKGLKNRMSGHVAHKPALNQGKGENYKLTASKILGAFKRSFEDNRQSQVIPDLQAYQQHQMRTAQRQQRPPQQQPQHHFAGQLPYGQTQSLRPSSQFGSQPSGQVATLRPSSQFSNQSMGQMQAKRQSLILGSPTLPQQQFQRSSGSFLQGQPGMVRPSMGQAQPGYTYQSPSQAQGQWQHQIPSPGGQFPPAQSRQASYTGQWQGTFSQTPNTLIHRSPQHSQLPREPHGPRHGYSVQRNVSEQESHPIHVSTPVKILSPTPVRAPSQCPSLLNLQAMIPSGNNGGNNVPAQEGQHEDTEAASRNDQINISCQGNPRMQRFAGNNCPYSDRISGSPGGGINPPPAQHASPRIGTDRNGAPNIQTPIIPMLAVAAGAAAGPVAGGQAATSTNGHFSPKAGESHDVSLSSHTGAPDNVSLNSTRQSPLGVTDLAPPEAKASEGSSFHAELENTEDARKRTLRISSQEEKTHYDPNADSDGELPPQMTATSYPGQEWDPYGMPEMGDWNEGLDR